MRNRKGDQPEQHDTNEFIHVTLERLKQEETLLEGEIDSLTDRYNKIQLEIKARRFGVRVNEKLEIEGKTYVVTKLDFWPELNSIKPDGTVSLNHRNAYRWEDYKEGKKTNPW